MNYKKVIKGGLTTALLTAAITSANAVPVHINSGNPAYPFPQFLAYACGGNLGTKNAEGLTHIEMEMMMRKAYQQHANEFEYTGEEHEGIKYIHTPYKAAYDCSEGDGYALLAAAYMADKVTFDGYWMCTHDKRRVKTKRYKDCTDNAPDYKFGDFAISDGADEGGNTAADGDVDVALALYVAYKQWGEFMLDSKGEKVLDACGNPINYKQEMINVVRGLVALSTSYPEESPRRVNSGIIGLDGYQKGGDTWNEQTDWASQKENYTKGLDGVLIYPEYEGDREQHIDYNAPAYFREFHDLLISLGAELGATNGWEAEQFRRAEASSDWLIGDLIKKNAYSLPTAGWCTVSRDGKETTYSNFNEGEDYRCPSRTISNYVWHGNPDYTWNPATHQVEEGGNTFEFDAAKKLSRYMADPAHWNEAAGTSCYVKGDKPIPYTGPRMMGWMIDPMTGANAGLDLSSSLGMQKGAASFAAIGAQDYELMGDLYNCIYQIWDVKGTTDEGDLISNYMSGWFRQLGLMALSGNFPAPSAMEPKANLKIYRALKDSMSFCHPGETVTYLLSYRNMGSVDAENVTIVENVPAGFEVTAIADGGVYNANTHTITWEIGKVSGFKSDDKAVGPAIDFTAPNLAATMGCVSYSCKPSYGTYGKFRTTAKIACKNGLGSETDNYPNYNTATMQFNSIDVLRKHLNVSKTAGSNIVAKGDVVTFNVAYSNDTLPWLTGGRQNVNIAVAGKISEGQYKIMLKLYHDAAEPYIDNGNYRVSFFKDLSDVNLACNFEVLEGTQNGQTMASNANEFVFTDKKIGGNSHMFSIQFPHSLAVSTLYMNEMAGASGYTCEGARYPLRVVTRFNDMSWKALDFTNGFSQLHTDSDMGYYYPVSPSYQDPTKILSIDKLVKSACDVVDKVTETVMVEEYDGYTWRLILGNTPLTNGADANDIVVTDTLPLGFEFTGSVNDGVIFTPAAEGAGYAGTVSLKLPILAINQGGSFEYTCKFIGSDKAAITSSSHIASGEEDNTSEPLVLTTDAATAIMPTKADAENGPVNVYTPSGTLLKQNVNANNALNGLKNGIYIVGDKKQLKVQK